MVCYKLVHEYSTSPDITFLAKLSSKNLRCHEQWLVKLEINSYSPNLLLKLFVSFKTNSKVNKFNNPGFGIP